jgi:mannose-1-phosphate guanylyltransferase
MKNNYLAIMAGGIGSRFWPASNEHKPKQFLDILGVGKSLLRATYERFSGIFPHENIFIVTNKRYNGLVKSQIPEISESNIINEPSRNNTGPSVAYTAFKIHSLNPDANIIMAPSDHLILKEREFLKIVDNALDFASGNEAILTLGIPPDRPDTGYGYIELSDKLIDADIQLYKVKSFREKPDLKTAENYLLQKKYLWNAGIFIFNANTILAEFRKYAPGIYDILETGINVYNTGSEKEFIEKTYPLTTNISIDYAIMEKSDKIYTLVSDISWSDLGTWNSLHAFLDKDSHDNTVIDANGIFMNSSGNIVKAQKNKPVYVRDLDNYIIVDENDTLLIFPISKEQEIKDIPKDK